MIYMLSREGIAKQALDEYHEQRQILNRHVVSALVLSEPILKAIRRELRKMSPKMRIEADEIKALLATEILKRDIVEGQDIKDAKRKVKRAYRRAESRRESSPAPQAPPAPLTDKGTACLPDQAERQEY